MVVELVDDDGRQPHGELVEHEQPRARRHGAGQRQHLLLAARQRAGRLVAAIRQAREPFERATLDVSSPRTAVRHDPEVLPHGQVREHAAALGNQAESPAGQRRRRSHAHLLTGEADLALARPHDAGRQGEEGRLSGTVCPEDSGDDTLFEGHVDPVDHLDFLVGRPHATELQEGFRHRPQPPIPCRDTRPGPRGRPGPPPACRCR